ncbi:hypothetical protein IP86_10755 [Rhodopseudomonas sp. AAP120]|uniref:hypothetical protein n=1 Tax=Rhodopseudomonas sp. AAP120 TaxID=1523430 RepID=UPI0006B88B2F|nr:hypothetical protein [Rhodopseudomonas sp. AAP120]KPF98802.1 hypothetical protein IP86_10755 [Rhodopseudomonas sp. AAP120]
MAREFETKYRVGKVDEILKKENAFRQDVDMRLDAIERALDSLGNGADTLVARVLRVIEQEISPRAAEIEALLTNYREGVPASAVEEEPDGRQFLTPMRRAAILSDLRGGVAADGDTLAKLLALIVALDTAKAPSANPHLTGVPTAPTAALGTSTNQIATMAALLAMRNDLVNGAGPSLDQINELAAALNNDANFGSAVLEALANRLRTDVDQALSAPAVAQTRKNIRVAPAIKSANYAASAADIGRSLILQGTATLSFDTIANLGVGWELFVRNDNALTGIWTLNGVPSGLTIDGAPSIKLYPGEGCRIVAEAGGLRTFGRATGKVLIARQIVSAPVAAVSFTAGVSTDFREIIFAARGVTHSKPGTSPRLRARQGGADITAGYQYGFPFINASAISFDWGTNSETSWALMDSGSNTGAGSNMNLRAEFPAFADTGNLYKSGRLFTAQMNPHAAVYPGVLGLQMAGGCDGLTYFSSDGNVAAGEFSLYGVR